MQLSEFARRIVSGCTLDDKLVAVPATLVDRDAGEPVRIMQPGRPPELAIQPATDVRVPDARGFSDPAQRPRILHALANHELQAVELFAWAILAFPTAPTTFRRGLLQRTLEEQVHLRLYIRALERNGSHLGAYPVSGYFWNKLPSIDTPLEFVAAMCLTFEGANLDHSLQHAQIAREAGDLESAQLFEQVHRDEVTHVAFGWHWLNAFKSAQQTPFDAYAKALHFPLRPALSRGRSFSKQARHAAGMDDAFIGRLEQANGGR